MTLAERREGMGRTNGRAITELSCAFKAHYTH